MHFPRGIPIPFPFSHIFYLQKEKPSQKLLTLLLEISLRLFVCMHAGLNCVLVFESKTEKRRGILFMLIPCISSELIKGFGNVNPLYWPFVLLPIRSTAHPTYCNILDLRHLFIFVLFKGSVRLRQFLGRALRLGRARGPSAAARIG